jgi:hypothetical protein
VTIKRVAYYERMSCEQIEQFKWNGQIPEKCSLPKHNNQGKNLNVFIY